MIVTGEIGRKRAKITVHDGRDGSLLGQAAFPGANPRKMAAEVARTFWSKLGGEVERGRVPSGAKKAQKVVAEAPDDDESAPDAGDAAEPKAKLAERGGASEGAGTGRRRPTTPDPAATKTARRTTTCVREEASAGRRRPAPCRRRSTRSSRPPAPTGPSPTIRTSARRACARTRCRSPPRRPCTSSGTRSAPCPAARYNTSASRLPSSKRSACDPQPGTDGSALAGRTFGNSVHDYAGGLRYRIPFGAGHQVWISGTAGEHAFVFTSPSDCSDCRAMLHIPDTVYRYGRPGIGLRLELPGDFSVTLGGGYRYIFNAGGTHLDGYFPHRTVGGVDAELALGYRITPNAGDPRLGPAAPLLLRHAFEGRRRLPRGWGDRSVLDRRPRDGGSAGRQQVAARATTPSAPAAP